MYDENRVQVNEFRRGALPSVVPWSENGVPSYAETDIRVGKQKYYVLLSEPQVFFGGYDILYFNVTGKDGFEHKLTAGKTCFIQIEISGMIGNSSPAPKTKFVTMYVDGQKVTVKDVSDELPQI